MKKALLYVLIICALMLLASCETLTGSGEPCSIYVQGESTITVDPDMVYFSIEVSELAPTTSEAQQLANAKISAIMAVIRLFGVEDRDLVTRNLSFWTDYSWIDGQRVVNGERVSQEVYVTMYDLNSFPALLDKLAASVSGINLGSVSFDSRDREKYYAQAREQAVEDARLKAEAYADAGDLRLGKPSSISEGAAYRSSANKAAMLTAAATVAESAYIASDIPTGELNITATVSVTFKAY